MDVPPWVSSPRRCRGHKNGCRSKWLHPLLDRRADRAPCRVATLHVLRIKADLAQRDRGLAPDVKAIGAVDHDRVRLRQLTGPFLHALGIAPRRAVDDVLGT